MALIGKSFSVDTGNLDNVLGQINKERKRADTILFKKVSKATDIIYTIAHSKRPMITKAVMRAQGRRTRVSDPEAKAGVPVRTGALQASIQKEVSQKSNSVVGRIFTKSPYAAFIEFGTSKMPARPFMRPALELAQDALKLMFKTQEDA